MKNEKNYYLGLDIGTDSVGYAAADEEYSLLKYKGEPMWGVHLFDAAITGEERRAFRTSRRRLDRRQQRLQLLEDIFVSEIAKIDPKFFIRRKESALWRDDANEPFSVFNDDGFTDKEYYEKYPTIHHLIWDLISNKEPHDVRLVYIAISWLVAHRGHFLNEVSKENMKDVLDINNVYETFYKFFEGEKPWKEIDIQEFGNIIKNKVGITKKYKELCMFLYDSSKASKEITEEFPYSREGILKLLCGGEYSLKNLFGKEEYAELSSINMSMKDEDFANVLGALGDDSEIILNIKSLYDWTVLSDILSEGEYISKAKVSVYEQHKKDLKFLKKIVRKYIPEKYNEVFRTVDSKLDNYASYSGNFKSEDDREKQKKKNKEAFSKYISSLFKNVSVDFEDEEAFSDMTKRLELRTFMPKQVDSDNRVLPYQVYWTELDRILKNAQEYLPFLNEKKDGYTVNEKILSVFEFRVPYFVGPLNRHSDNSWFCRLSEGKIFPWNFSELVNLDESEEAFIKRMTNRCTYLPDCSAVAKNSLIYQKFTVLNEINCITVNDKRLSVSLKQKIYNELFLKKKKVTVKAIKDLLHSEGSYTKEELEKLEGLDTNVKSTLSSYIAFEKLINSNQLSEDDVEKIIERSTYSESKARFALWLDKYYPSISKADKKYIRSLKFKDFGRLSKEFLCDVQGANKETGEVNSIIKWMWETNQNLNEILSENYSFREEIEQRQKEYYDANPKSLSKRLDEMYVSNGVKRPIIRALDIVSDVVKVCGHAPEKIFIEMARGGKEDEKGVRKESRLKQLKDFYAKIDGEDIRELEKTLDAMGDEAHNKLQSEKLYLYYLQLGKCMYSGEPISLSELSSKRYDIDHIYPRSKVKDDSIFNNKVLVLTTLNEEKKDKFPIKAEIREKMQGFWKKLLDNNLITNEKYKRLTRSTPFSEDEEWGFINRQLVETRQSTKVVASLLKEKYPKTEIVYVKANLASDFRKQYDLLKCRSVNDLHHAKDAYLNIVVGNVYHECFTKKWFLENREKYSIKTETLFEYERIRNGKVVWGGKTARDKVENIVRNKNAVHLTKYAFCRYGGFFDQMPVKAGEKLVERKKGLSTEKYGGYTGKRTPFFALVGFECDKKKDLWIMPIETLVYKEFLNDDSFAEKYTLDKILEVQNKKVDSIFYPLGKRILKVNTMFDFDGMRMCLASKDSETRVCFSLFQPLWIEYKWEVYIKRLERFVEKRKANENLVYSEKFDLITQNQNLKLYDLLIHKVKSKAYIKRPSTPFDLLEKGRTNFERSDIYSQSLCLLQMLLLLGRKHDGVDLSTIGGGKHVAKTRLNSFVSNWKKNFSDVRIIDISASGLYESKSENLLDLI